MKERTYTQMKKINVGVIGLGPRGLGLIRTMLVCEECQITALCDVYEDRLDEGRKIVADKQNKHQPIPSCFVKLFRHIKSSITISLALVCLL